ncbi:MAG: FtsX-like permease family protein [Gammaproteobacteria bacterium]|nr:FtsX-like permease family protein [Gammaproteobacteria bacterium]MYF02631.1 FtsX-like permease family protein [Gammaproteobacteria bacterium]MYI76999.1 FtsX-like permease family protein [Gammaproteobacteria bacterium]
MTNKSRVLFILRVSSRYLLSKRSGNSRLINVISFIGLVLGLTLLLVVLAVLNGNRNEIDDYIFSVYPHAIARVNSDQVQLLDELQSLPGVTSIEPFVDLYGSLSVRGRALTPESGIAVYGFSADSSNRTFRQMYTALKEPRDLPLAGMDYYEASAWGLSRGDTFSLTVPLVNSRGVHSKTVAFRYAGPLWLSNDSKGTYSKILYVRISDLIAHGIVTEDQVHHRITLDEPKRARNILGQYPEVVTWMERFGSLYQALAMEKTILFVLLLFVIGLVIMSVISGQAMFINRKSSDIAILQTLGAELRWVSIVFMCQGAIIVVSGIVVGAILGCVVAHYAHDIMHFIQRFQEDERNIPDLTVYLESANVAVQDLIWTILAVLIVGFVAILRPLRLVFKKDPVESLNRVA